ncbi:hypothetical protein NQ117_07315 [Paenibacillus sp. SC116]|uniref:hypothetical protein n=1 Tax=Paenibacillus sp. SC116 TaxID=2968986 RepID=UPI00215AA029|nr:hypothetical protein [Paenibacillus sp. SC116]MCR8843489.1 hypothetical protein [Paenibacillus sp. SC116]
MRKIIEFGIVAVAFGIVGVSLGSVALLLISGYWFDSIVAKILGIVVVWAIVALYAKAAPFNLNNVAKALIIILLSVISIYLFQYPFGDGYLQ